MAEEIVGKLIAKRGPQPDASWELIAGRALNIGRAAENDVVIPDETVSRRHATLVVEKENVRLKNYGGNGSQVNQKPVNRDESVSLSHDDLIVIGAWELQIELVHHADQESVLLKTVFWPGAAVNSGEKLKTVMSTPNSQKPDDTGKATTRTEIKGQVTTMLPELKNKKPRLAISSLQTPLAKVCLSLMTLIGIFMLLAPAEKNSVTTAEATEQPIKFTASNPDSDKTILEIQGPLPEAELKKVNALLGRAEKQFAERDLRDQNLYESIHQWETAIAILQRYAARSTDDSLVAQMDLQKAKALLEQRVRNWKKEIYIYEQKKDYATMQALLQKIMQAIPDLTDPRYRWAKNEENKIKPRLE